MPESSNASPSRERFDRYAQTLRLHRQLAKSDRFPQALREPLPSSSGQVNYRACAHPEYRVAQLGRLISIFAWESEGPRESDCGSFVAWGLLWRVFRQPVYSIMWTCQHWHGQEYTQNRNEMP